MGFINKKDYILTVLLLLVGFFSLSGCMGRDVFEGGELSNPATLFDADNLITEGKKRSEESIDYGPKPIDVGERSIESGHTSILSKEQKVNHVSVDEGDSFNVSVNVENMDIRTFMEMLSKVIGTNIIVSDEVEGRVTAHLDDVPWSKVLHTVLSVKQLAQYVDKDANIIRIHDQKTIELLEGFEQKRKADQQKAAVLLKAAMPMTTKIFKLFYTKPEEIKALLESVLEPQTTDAKSLSVRDTTAQITTDSRLNQIIVKARPDDMHIIEKLISDADSRTKQVFIEAFIVEATDGFSKALGSRLGFTGSNTYTDRGWTADGSVAGLGGGGSPGSIALGTGDSSISDFAVGGATSGVGIVGSINNAATLKLELSAMEAEGLTKVISNPRIYTLDNQEATIFQGIEVPYETVSDSGTQIEFKEAGLKLAVTPTVVGDGNLMLKITVNKDTVDTSVSNPPITKSEINTNLVTKDGEIVVMGGIFTQARTKSRDQTPLLGDIPLLGNLFSRDIKSDDKQELMIFIAPRVL